MMTSWFFALGTAAWFGAMALRAGRSWSGWALGGALFALVTSTIVLGVSHAMFLPMSRAVGHAYEVKSLAVTLLVVLALGWLLTISLHRHPHLLLKALKKKFIAGGPD